MGLFSTPPMQVSSVDTSAADLLSRRRQARSPIFSGKQGEQEEEQPQRLLPGVE